MKAGIRVRYLLTMMTDDGERSRSHGLSPSVLELQAASLGIPIMMLPTSWNAYEATYLEALRELRAFGIGAGVFGAIDVAEHRNWIERVCQAAELQPILPLWQRERQSIVDELARLRFNAIIVAVRDNALGKEFLGRAVNRTLFAPMQSSGIDICGENGEYHTFVTMGPDFAFPVALDATRPVFHDGYWVLSDESRGEAIDVKSR